MSITHAAILGLIQGITEFLPISSSGHLILAETVLGLQVEGLKAFDIALHLGTLIAILLYFRTSLLDFKKYPLLVLGSIPAVLVGFTLGDQIDTTFRSAGSVAIALILVGALFFLPMQKGEGKLSKGKALLIGMAQALALIPGVSRSGATILCGNQLGLSQTEAARFSFLLGAIAIAGAGVLKALDGDLGGMEFPVLATGFSTAFVSSLLAVNFLMQYLSKHSLKAFGVYRIALGVLILLTF